MGRYSTDVPSGMPPQQPNGQQLPQNPFSNPKPFNGMGGSPYGQQNQMGMQQNPMANWPQVFPKAIIGLDRDGVINVDKGDYITSIDQVEMIPGSLEAIRMMRLKGYKVVILTNQGGIQKGLQTHAQVDAIHQHFMQVFGQAGIFSIDGLYYSESSLKDDYYAKPNIGMFERAETEIFGGQTRFKDGGFYVGDKISDMKAAYKAGATPILVRTGHGQETEQELGKHANKKLKAKVYNNLLEFAQGLA